MITLHAFNSKTSLPDADYVLDKPEKLPDILCNLTPKFEGTWCIILLSPKIKFVREMLDLKLVPNWAEVMCYMSQKAIDELALESPELTPKKRTAKDEYENLIAGMKHLIDDKAKVALWNSLGPNIRELSAIINKLDAECEDDAKIIKMADIKGVITTQKRVYASDVMRAFLLYDKKRWELYDKLIHDIGIDIAYFAMYKCAKNLLHDKGDFLLNKDVKNYTARKVDATFICYVYVLFANSHSSQQLPAILHSIENRCEDMLEYAILERK